MRKRAKVREQQQLADLANDFDPAFYLDRNPDVRAAGISPCLHYLWQGWREGRNPNAWFDGDLYLRLHSDVAALGLNPLLHYVRFGRDEGRTLSAPPGMLPSDRPHDALRRLIEGARPARDVAADYAVPPTASSIEIGSLTAALLAATPSGVTISFSHDDYAENFGGVQRLIGIEADHYRNADWAYLHLAPARPLPILSDEVELSTFAFQVRVNGDALGHITAAECLAALNKVRRAGVLFDLVVHHFMGHSPEIIARICEELDIECPHIWVHDFYTLCENYNLLRNDWKFCGAPRVESVACRICAHGAGRPAHFDRMRYFFAMREPAILAPSEAALKAWRNRGLAFRESHVVPIAHLVRGVPFSPQPKGDKLRVGFLGQSAHAKGWTTFRKLVAELGDAHGYDFFHLGTRIRDDHAHPHIRYVPVQANRNNRDAMTRALAEHQIDIVVLWPAWPESFCYAAHEALAAGAVVLTNNHSGNIPSILAMHAPDRSAVLESEAELVALFADRDELEMLCAKPGYRGVVLPFESSAHVTLRRRLVAPSPSRPDTDTYRHEERADD